MEHEQISVIVPVYNVAPYLEKCVESIRGQSYANLEIILVDDGSTDHSGTICDRYATMDPRVRVLHKANGGLSDARNTGLEIANGSWYMFIDSDDSIAPDTVMQLYTAAVTHDCQIAVCNMVRIYEDGSTEPFYHPTSEITILSGSQRLETLQQPSVCNKLFRADLFENVRFPVGKFYEDTFVYHILAYQAEHIVLTGQDSYYYFSRPESILGQKKYTDRYFDFIEAIYARMIYLLEHGVEHYGEEACLSLYAAVACGERYLARTPDNAPRFKQMRRWYRVAYDHLIKRTDTGWKQKLRLILLRFCPKLHSGIYLRR